MKNMPSLDIIAVNWNAGRLLKDCLGSIASTSREGFALNRVVIVDNGSEDGSLEAALSDFSDGGCDALLPIRNSANVGFGKACNQGARGSSADYLLFLNPDARLFEHSLSGAIAEMEKEENADVGICGVQLLDETGSVARSCARSATSTRMAIAALGLDRLFGGAGIVMNEWDHSTSRDVDHVIGAFYLVRRSVFEALHGFDERFFVYLEDLDFSERARALGWRCRYLAEIKAYHKGGGVSEQAKARRLAYSLESRLRYGAKHFSMPATFGISLLTFAVEPLLRLARAGTRLSAPLAKETLEGYWLLSSALVKKPLRKSNRVRHGVEPLAPVDPESFETQGQA